MCNSQKAIVVPGANKYEKNLKCCKCNQEYLYSIDYYKDNKKAAG